MLTNQTVERLISMKLRGFADSYKRQLELLDINSLCFDERLAMLVEDEWLLRQTRRQQGLIKKASMRDNASLEGIDYSFHRNLDRSLISRLSVGTWLNGNQSIIVSGPTGVGKTFISCALGNMACRLHHSVKYYRVPRLLSEIAMCRGDGSYIKLLDSLRKVKVLILDDWGISPMSSNESREILEIIEDRTNRCCTVIAGQVSPEHWHEVISDPTVADAIIDRLIHGSHIISLKGDSVRRHKNAIKSSHDST